MTETIGHLDHAVTTVAETAAGHLHGRDQAVWLARLESGQANLRAALRWAWDSDDADAVIAVAGEIVKGAVDAAEQAGDEPQLDRLERSAVELLGLYWPFSPSATPQACSWY